MRIISIGDLVTDFYYKNGKLVGVNGGMTSHNIIANIAKLGLETSVCGVCGDDMAGTIAINSLKEVGKTQSQVQTYILKEFRRVFNRVLRPQKLMHALYTYGPIQEAELTGRLSGEEVKTELKNVESKWEYSNTNGKLIPQSQLKDSELGYLKDWLSSPMAKKIALKREGESGLNNLDENSLQQLDQLTNFTNYNKLSNGGWLDKF